MPLENDTEVYIVVLEVIDDLIIQSTKMPERKQPDNHSHNHHHT